MVHEHLFGAPDNTKPTSMPQTFAPLSASGATYSHGRQHQLGRRSRGEAGHRRGRWRGRTRSSRRVFQRSGIELAGVPVANEPGPALRGEFADQGATSFKIQASHARRADQLDRRGAQARTQVCHLCAVTYRRPPSWASATSSTGWAATDFVENKPADSVRLRPALGAALEPKWTAFSGSFRRSSRTMAAASALAVFGVSSARANRRRRPSR